MKDFLADSLTACFAMAGMKVELSGGYSGWQPNVDSPILHAMKLSYKQQFGVEPAVKVIHADRKSTRLNSSHIQKSRMPSPA